MGNSTKTVKQSIIYKEPCFCVRVSASVSQHTSNYLIKRMIRKFNKPAWVKYYRVVRVYKTFLSKNNLFIFSSITELRRANTNLHYKCRCLLLYWGDKWCRGTRLYWGDKSLVQRDTPLLRRQFLAGSEGHAFIEETSPWCRGTRHYWGDNS